MNRVRFVIVQDKEANDISEKKFGKNDVISGTKLNINFFSPGNSLEIFGVLKGISLYSKTSE